MIALFFLKKAGMRPLFWLFSFPLGKVGMGPLFDFFYRQRRLFDFVPFQPAIRQARMGVAGNIRESALEILSDTHGRNRAKP